MTPLPRRVLIGMTSHDSLGDTGRSTGAYIPEVAHAWRVFADAGYDVDLMSVAGGRPPLDAVDRADPVQRAFLDDPVMAGKLCTTLTADQVDPAGYAAVFWAGGHGAAWDLPHDAAGRALTARLYDSGRAVGAVCHGPAALVNVVLADGRPLVAGHTVAAFTDAEEKAIGMTKVVPFLLSAALAEQGAAHAAGPSFLPHAVVSGRLVTGQNPASATVTAEALVEVLEHLQGDAHPVTD